MFSRSTATLVIVAFGLSGPGCTARYSYVPRMESQLRALEPGARLRIGTRAIEQLESPALSIRLFRQETGSANVRTGVTVRGGSSRSLGKGLWLVEPNDGDRAILFPTGSARVDGHFVAFDSAFVVLELDGRGGEVALPLDGVAWLADPGKGTAAGLLVLVVAATLVGGLAFLMQFSGEW